MLLLQILFALLQRYRYKPHSLSDGLLLALHFLLFFRALPKS
uniref:ORF3c protein n=1 Tax=Severe acute respiratory syndrome coronavirus 2 TaxID=2697049 RepID=ORF3C_SARS2|nr:RecName: Full=ORF3c protein; Short=ORF3c; AltName: Full=ORF3h protein; Short=ORF3h [Severe acute respiratory syndrome coronavirus 2]